MDGLCMDVGGSVEWTSLEDFVEADCCPFICCLDEPFGLRLRVWIPSFFIARGRFTYNWSKIDIILKLYATV